MKYILATLLLLTLLSGCTEPTCAQIKQETRAMLDNPSLSCFTTEDCIGDIGFAYHLGEYMPHAGVCGNKDLENRFETNIKKLEDMNCEVHVAFVERMQTVPPKTCQCVQGQCQYAEEQ